MNPKSVKNLSERNRLIYKDFISEDTVIKSDDEKIISLAKQIVGKEINPYNQAKLVYNYMIDNYTLLLSLKKADSSPYNLIEEKRGDSYDFSVVYTALLRALKIPSVTDSGILVDSKLTSQTHWWNEFYIENMGWIPVDISLGAGMNYDSFKDIENGRDFYFGNLDSQHIAFSRGWNELKRTLAQDSVIVYRPKTFSMQSIWEESLANNVSYSSFWNDPIVNGVY